MIKIFELFAGIGAIRKAFIDSHIPFDVIGISEIDKFAIQSYNSLYGETKNYGDISQIDSSNLPDFDMLIFGFPCQDISIAGKQNGLDENSGTRSSLLWQALRIIREKKPTYLLMENVKNLIGPTHKQNFEKYLNYLRELGYKSSYSILNLNNFGIPQNRERLFCFSSLVNDPKIPEGKLTNKCLRDFLESTVDRKYYMNKPFVFKDKGKNQKSGLHQIGSLEMKATDSIKRVYAIDGMCPTLTTMQGGHREPKILDNGEVRKLTPRECWRLMGFTDDDFDKVSYLSNAQLYKQIGNSIGVPVLVAILKENFK